MALQKDRNRINVTGVEDVRIYELVSGGAVQTMLSVGEVESVQIIDNHSLVKSSNSRGQMLNSQSGSEEVSVKVILKQSAKDELDLLRLASGKFYHLYVRAKASNPTVTYEELYFPLSKIKPGFDLTFAKDTERKPVLELDVLMPKGAVSVTPSGLNVAADAYYTLAETATTALGEVTTATGTIYTAAV